MVEVGSAEKQKPIAWSYHAGSTSEMVNDFLELFATWTPSADTHRARDWFEKHGLSVTPMRNGALLSGSRPQIEQAFAVSLDRLQPPANLPVPPELTEHVAALRFPRPPSYHA